MSKHLGQLLRRSLEHAGALQASLQRAAHEAVISGADEVVKSLRYQSYLLSRLVEAGVVPAMQSALQLQQDIAGPLLDAARGQRPLQEGLEEITARTVSGARYFGLVATLGRELFGSATFAGERLLAQTRYLKLSYLPSQVPGADLPPLLHVGGFLPYSDRIFRILPEANLFVPFVRSGVPVYAIELRGDKAELGDLSGFSLEQLIDALAELAAVAFAHGGGRKMIIEGYCGLGMPMLAFLAARPEEAARQFCAAMTMVSPVDGRQCHHLAQLQDKLPQTLLWTQLLAAELLGGYVDGDSLRASMDIPLGTFFAKTPLGCFMRGWKKRDFSRVQTAADLTAAQRRELAGAYWISPDNCRRFPIPLAQAQLSARLWTQGLDERLLLPLTYRGRPLSLHAIAQQTEIPLVGFYGGKDLVVPEQTAHVLRAALGQRYTHVVHPQAGHISYVLSPELWDPQTPGAFDPNPLQLVLSLARG